jgi:hypothetical protein
VHNQHPSVLCFHDAAAHVPGMVSDGLAIYKCVTFCAIECRRAGMYDAGVAAAAASFYNTSAASSELNQNSLPYVAYHHQLPGQCRPTAYAAYGLHVSSMLHCSAARWIQLCQK